METIQNIKEKNTNNFYKVPGMAFDIIKLRTDLENILKKRNSGMVESQTLELYQ